MLSPSDPTAAAAVDAYQQRFGQRPHWIAAAPGRVNLIGEHVDYNDGFVLPMAIDRYTVIAGGPRDGDSALFASSSAEAPETVVINSLPAAGAVGGWASYPVGVLAGCVARGMQPGGFQCVIESSVPLGGGLSSSAALEVATATLIEAICDTQIPPAEKALLCQAAERDFAGVPCGIMDQFASVFCRAGHALLLDCRSQVAEQIPFADDSVSVLITNSNVKHALGDGEYAQRRAECELAVAALDGNSLRDVSLDQLVARENDIDPTVYRRARHVVTEIDRTQQAAEAFRESRWSEVGQLMFASHDSLRDDFEVSCEELDELVDLAREIGEEGGVFGARMTGGGFGGCTVSLVATAQASAVASQIASGYQQRTGQEATQFTTRPADGAHIVG